eukprot:SAG31_NODE_9566_length_1258_cov_1.303710_2_plen_165_part_01
MSLANGTRRARDASTPRRGAVGGVPVPGAVFGDQQPSVTGMGGGAWVAAVLLCLAALSRPTARLMLGAEAQWVRCVTAPALCLLGALRDGSAREREISMWAGGFFRGSDFDRWVGLVGKGGCAVRKGCAMPCIRGGASSSGSSPAAPAPHHSPPRPPALTTQNIS